MASHADIQLYENVYNRHLRQDEPKLKLWRYAGLIITYRCNAACRFCYYNCAPDRNGLMPTDTAIRAWRSLKKLAPKNAKIHITGGEPFLHFDRVVEILTHAQKENLGPLDTIETNAFWATDKKNTIDRLKMLDSLGMNRLKISWDPFHAEFIPLEPVKLLAQTAEKVLGPNRVLVRWAKYLQEPVKISGMNKNQRREQYRLALRDYPVRFTGRASEALADIFADKPPQTFLKQTCKSDFLNSKGVHIDPYGNVFSGMCSGIIAGNLNLEPLENIWKALQPPKMPFIGDLFSRGPASILKKALNFGYKPRKNYADKCHLCSNLRQFFFDIGKYTSIIAPCDCYFRQSETIPEN